jgi:ParB/RepB/Spo0J family partition protein
MSDDGPEKTLPIVVRKTPGGYELVDGEHRWRIAKELGWQTINALEREADDLQSRVLCISYNRWRGRLNWLKLYDIIKKDQDQGIDLKVAYQEALSGSELDWLFSLGDLISSVKPVLEEALKRHPEITLEHLYLLSQFPPTQQESLVERFKNPVVTHALMQALTPFIQKNQIPPHKETQPQISTQIPTQISPPQTYLTQKNPTFSTPKEPLPQLTPNTKPPPDYFFPNQNLQPNPTLSTNPPFASEPIAKKETQKAILLAVSCDCDCGRHYNINFKNKTILVQKQNQLYEHADTHPHTYQIYCNKCSTTHEFIVENIETLNLQIFCRRCKPPREGHLDLNTSEATWIA